MPGAERELRALLLCELGILPRAKVGSPQASNSELFEPRRGSNRKNERAERARERKNGPRAVFKPLWDNASWKPLPDDDGVLQTDAAASAQTLAVPEQRENAIVHGGALSFMIAH